MGEPQGPKGRAALIQKLRQQKTSQVGIGIPPQEQAASSEQLPKPSGRAALLKKLKDSRQTRVGLEMSVPISTPTIVAGGSGEGSGDQAVVQESVAVTERLRDIKISSEKEKVTYKGEAGKPVNVSSNYVKLNVEKDTGVFEYEVKFQPDVDSKGVRFKIINGIMTEMGSTKMFDGGAVLYLPRQVTDSTLNFNSSIPSGEPVVVQITYKRKRDMSECLHLYNVLFKKIMRVLMYSQMGRSYINAKDKHMIPQHRLEVYPGFAVTVDALEGGLLLCLDTQHRVLRSQNVYELMVELKNAPDFKKAFSEAVIGQSVLTRYNNKTYTISDVAWDTSPRDKFETADGSEISFIEYYRKQYNLSIHSETQPLLVHRKAIKAKDGSGKVDRLICLIPELSFLTGLTDAMRADFRVMKDVAEYTRVTPAQRVNALKIYLRNVSNSPEAQQILLDWGLRLDPNVVELQGRNLDTEVILFGDNQECKVRSNCDWTRAVTEYKSTLPIDLTNWVLFHTVRDKPNASNFAETMTRMGTGMGCTISRPRIIQLMGDRNENYVEAINQYVTPGVQCAVFICPSLRADRYGVIKKLCCTQIPVASQVIMSRTLSNQSKVRAIIQKIALQINCKLGGTLWTIRFPFKNWMIIGIDVYHSAKGSKSDSVCAMVSSLNESISRWYSTAIPQKGELSEFYKIAFTKALENFRRVNGAYPDKIVVFRDGVGDGQLEHCKRYEIAQFEETLRQFQLDIKLCFVVVQKRINTRIFLQGRQGLSNPEPGVVVDHTITRRYLSDFFLIPQNVRQGTVNPTHYIVLHDTCGLRPDHVQRLAFKLCHLYYNWSGTIRVPAPCQYAHKLAALYGQHLNKPVCTELADKLYYL